MTGEVAAYLDILDDSPNWRAPTYRLALQHQCPQCWEPAGKLCVETTRAALLHGRDRTMQLPHGIRAALAAIEATGCSLCGAGRGEMCRSPKRGTYMRITYPAHVIRVRSAAEQASVAAR